MKKLFLLLCLFSMYHLAMSAPQVDEEEDDTSEVDSLVLSPAITPKKPDTLQVKMARNKVYIDNQKTKLSKKDIEKLLVGTWSFVAIKKIDSLTKVVEYDKNVVLDSPEEKIRFVAMRFKPNYIYAEELPESGTLVNSGSWKFDTERKLVEIRMGQSTYPSGNPAIFKNVTQISNEYVEEIMINKLTNNELVMIEPFPINAYENGYKLLLYTK